MTIIFFTILGLGCVAHELGTLPLQCYKPAEVPEKPVPDPGKRALVKPDLELVLRKGVYVCDLSIFPWSPEVNPTPTLVALALRLSRETILERIPPRYTKEIKEMIKGKEIYIIVMNQSGDKIKVLVSNHSGVDLTEGEKKDNKNGGMILNPGDSISRDRTRTPNDFDPLVESVMVFGLEFNSKDKFLLNPVNTYVAKPGVVCVIE